MFGITASLLAPMIGSLADRHGMRKVALLSLVGFIVTFISCRDRSPPITGCGLALGMMLIGASAAAFIVPKMAVRAIQNASWREMFPIVALLPLLIALPVGLLLFREQRPDEQPAKLSSADGSVAGMTFKEAARTK